MKTKVLIVLLLLALPLVGQERKKPEKTRRGRYIADYHASFRWPDEAKPEDAFGPKWKEFVDSLQSKAWKVKYKLPRGRRAGTVAFKLHNITGEQALRFAEILKDFLQHAGGVDLRIVLTIEGPD